MKLSDLSNSDIEEAVHEYLRIAFLGIPHDERIGQQLLAEFYRRLNNKWAN